MSIAALEAMEATMSAAVEGSPSSETFTIDPEGSPSTFKGIFDNSNMEGGEDSGHVTQKKRIARIMVSSVPDGLTKGITIDRENGDRYHYSGDPARDDEGMAVIWLY